MKRRSAYSLVDPLIRIFLFCLVGVGINLGVVWAKKEQSPVPPFPLNPSLDSLVLTYLQGSSEQSSVEQQEAIRNHPMSTMTSLASAIRQAPQYDVAPVGALSRQVINIRGREATFSLYVPPSYRPEKAFPLILCLHGAGFTGEAYLERWVPRLDDRYILVCPTISMGMWWTRFAEELVLATLREVQRRYHIDPDRVFLTGMSNGGIGAWIIGMHYANRFAGIAPMASGIDDVLYPFIENLINTPVYVLHGAEDRIMPVRLSRDLVREMDQRGILYVYREHTRRHPHAGGHFFPRQELPALIEWFDGQTRNPLPRRITTVRDATHLLPSGWVRMDATDRIAAFTENLIDGRDEFISGKVYAKLQADFVGPNTIAVTTLHVRRYTLFFNKELVDFSRPIVVKTNGRKSFEGFLEEDMGTMLTEAKKRSNYHTLYSAKVSIDVPSP